MRPELPRGPYLVVGLARSGAAAVRALRSRGAEVIGYDASADGAALAAELAIPLSVGAGADELLDGVGCVVKSPGVPREEPVIARAGELGIPVLGEMELGWRLVPAEFVAVTGTNGKTTTVELIGAIYRSADLPVEVVGNVGRAVCELVLEPPADGATIVCEASSFQLEDTTAFAPDAAVLLNLTEDHLDRHRTFDSYKEAKLRIFANQIVGAIAVLPDELAAPYTRRADGLGPPTGELVIPGNADELLFGTSERAALRLKDGVLHWHSKELIHGAALGARGPIANSMAAALVALERGVPIDAVREALRSFKGVEHRLEQVATIDGVLYVNDSKATNVASALVALDSFAAGSVLLILGGQGKSQDFSALRNAVATTAAHTYVIGEDGEQIAAALDGLPVTDAGTLERAFELAAAAAAPGMVVLLSPACASFDQFEDFEDRGSAFSRARCSAGVARAASKEDGMSAIPVAPPSASRRRRTKRARVATVEHSILITATLGRPARARRGHGLQRLGPLAARVRAAAAGRAS